MLDCEKNLYAKELNKFTFPLIIQHITGMLIGLVDEMFIGRISAEAYGAIGIMVALMNLLAGIFGNIAVTFNIEGAKKRGENDTKGFALYFIASIFIDIIMGIIYILIIIFFSDQILGNLYGLSGNALYSAKTYAFITCPYMLLQLLIFTFNAYFKIEKRTKRLMWISIAAALINVALDYLLVFGKFGLPRLETAGAALATIISVLFNAAALGMIIIKERKICVTVSKKIFSSSFYLMKESMPLIGEELLEGSIFVIVINAIVSNIGIMVISSYLLVKYFMDIIMIAMYMYGSAELTLVSERIGQSKYRDIMGLTIVGILISILIYAALSMIIIIFRDKVPALISNETGLIESAAKLILPMVLMNLFNPIQTILKYVLLACGKAKSVLCITAVINAAVLLYIVTTYFIDARLCFVFIGLFMNYFALSLIYAVYLRKIYYRYTKDVPEEHD